MSDSEKPKIWVSAILCADVIREVRGSKTIVTALRISNGFQATQLELMSGDEIAQVAFAAIEFKLIVTASCEVVREFDISFRLIFPNGNVFEDMLPLLKQKILGSGSGFTTIVNSTINPNLQGVYWFEIYVDQELSTKVPLVILHESQDSYLRSLEQKSAPMVEASGAAVSDQK